MVTNKQPNEQLGDPSASLLLTSEKAVFCNKSSIKRSSQGQVFTLKLSACTDGEFSCASGDCIKMEERCDQVGKKPPDHRLYLCLV